MVRKYYEQPNILLHFESHQNDAGINPKDRNLDMTDSKAQMVSFSETLRGKIVVADTSSLLIAGTGLLSTLDSCQLVIPAVVVKELELKRTHPTLGFLSREWLRLLEDLRVSHGRKLSAGVSLDEYPNVEIRVEPNHSAQSVLPIHLQDGSNDSTVLAVAKSLSVEDSKAVVVVLSNDIPMRLKATLDLDLDAYEFSATNVLGAKAFNGRYEITISADEFEPIMEEELSDEQKNVIFSKLPKDISKTAFIECKVEGTRFSDEFILSNGELTKVFRKQKAHGICGRTVEQDVAIAYLRKSADEVPIVSLGGGAGTGKTLLTLAVGLDELAKKNYQKVIVFRSLHEMGAGQEMGFLPGGVNEKMEAWAGAVFDAIDALAATKKSIKNKSDTWRDNALKDEVAKLRSMVEVSPITYLRGRSLADSYIVLEEAQNFSRSEILNILSRAGQGSKIVLTFDSAQVDNKYLQSGKDADIWSVIDSLKNESLFAHMTLTKTERSRVAELASRILEGS
jgi:PhoH-like ATPase